LIQNDLDISIEVLKAQLYNSFISKVTSIVLSYTKVRNSSLLITQS